MWWLLLEKYCQLLHSPTILFTWGLYWNLDYVAIQSLIVFEVTWLTFPNFDGNNGHLSGNNGNLFGNNRSIWGEILNRIIGRKSRIIWTGLVQSCFSPIAASDPLPLLLPVCLRFQLLLPDCARFSCCSPLASASAASPDRVRFGCYSPIASAARPIASASTAARPLRLLLPRLHTSAACWIRTFLAEFEVQ